MASHTVVLGSSRPSSRGSRAELSWSPLTRMSASGYLQVGHTQFDIMVGETIQ